MSENVLIPIHVTKPVPVKYTRNSEGCFVCPYCNEIKRKQNTMHYHIRREHEQDFPFQCKQCENQPRFLQKSSYLHHLATVHKENPHPNDQEKNQYATVMFHCPSCEHSTHTKANTMIHFARSHCPWIPSYTKNEPCKGCTKVFQSSSAYLYHATSCLKASASHDQANMLSRIK